MQTTKALVGGPEGQSPLTLKHFSLLDVEAANLPAF